MYIFFVNKQCVLGLSPAHDHKNPAGYMQEGNRAPYTVLQDLADLPGRPCWAGAFRGTGMQEGGGRR